MRVTITIAAGCEGMRVLVAGIEPGSTELGGDVQLLPAAVAGGEHSTEEHLSIGAVSKALKQRRKSTRGPERLGRALRGSIWCPSSTAT